MNIKTIIDKIIAVFDELLLNREHLDKLDLR